MADFDRIFAENGSKDTIDDAEYNLGWDDIVGDQPPKKTEFNSIMNEQDKKSLFLRDQLPEYAANGSSYLDSGNADAYVLSPIGANIGTASYTDMMNVNYIASSDNTGPSTANVNGLGVKDIKLAGGVDPSAGQISGRVKLIYDGSNDWLELQTTAATASDVAYDNSVTGLVATDVQGAIDESLGLGVDQAWQSFTGVKQAGVIYTNNETRPIDVKVSVQIFSALAAATFQLDGEEVDIYQGFTANAFGSISAIVPVGSTYQISIPSGLIRTWFELLK